MFSGVSGSLGAIVDNNHADVLRASPLDNAVWKALRFAAGLPANYVIWMAWSRGADSYFGRTVLGIPHP